jgi:Tfp pilus assembly protein FimT
MAGKVSNSNTQAGITVVELLVVCVVIAILAGFAMMQRGDANEQFQRQNIARELKFAFERARFDSVKRRADVTSSMAKVLVESGSFTLTTYRTLDGTTFTAENIQTSFAAQNIAIAGNGSTTVPVTVYFDQRGETVDGDEAPMSASFYVCNVSCASPGNDDANIVMITPTGTVNLLAGDANPQPFNPPTVAGPIGDAANIDLNSWTQMTPAP